MEEHTHTLEVSRLALRPTSFALAVHVALCMQTKLCMSVRVHAPIAIVGVGFHCLECILYLHVDMEHKVPPITTLSMLTALYPPVLN